MHGPQTAPGSITAVALTRQGSLAEADAPEAAPLQAGRGLTAQKGGAEVHAALKGASDGSQKGSNQSKATPAFWKSMAGLFAAPDSKAVAQLEPQKSPGRDEDPATVSAGSSSDASISAQGNTVHSAQPCPPPLVESEAVLHPEPTVVPQRSHAPPPARLVTLSAPSDEHAPEQPVTAAPPGGLTAVSPAGSSESRGAVGMLSEAEEVRSPERMGAVRPPIALSSPFALAALQAHSCLDSRTVAAIEAAVMSPKRGPVAQRQGAKGRGPPPMSAASALEGLQAELARGDLPSPVFPAPEDLESLGRPTVKAPTPGEVPPATLCHICALICVEGVSHSWLWHSVQAWNTFDHSRAAYMQAIGASNAWKLTCLSVSSWM